MPNKSRKPSKKQPKRQESLSLPRVTHYAAVMNQVNFGDHGTWGGNVTSMIYDIKENLSDTEKLLFIEKYLSLEQQEIIKWLFGE